MSEVHWYNPEPYRGRPTDSHLRRNGRKPPNPQKTPRYNGRRPPAPPPRNGKSMCCEFGQAVLGVTAVTFTILFILTGSAVFLATQIVRAVMS